MNELAVNELDAGAVGPALGLVALLAYLLGAIPVGLLVARAFGLGDVRKIGSGNIGATNVLRAGSKKAAAATLILDVLKGAAPALLAGAWLGPLGAAIGGFFAFLGHCYSPFLRFQGGKGVATGLGAILAWRWEVGLAALALWILLTALTRYVSLGSVAAAFFAVILLGAVGEWEAAVFAMLMALISLWRHRENMGRLLRGEENKISLGAKKDQKA